MSCNQVRNKILPSSLNKNELVSLKVENLLRKYFLDLISKYSKNENYNENCWADVKIQYSGKRRYYHNLNHLQNMLYEFEEVRDEIKEPDLILFAIFFHDIIYNPGQPCNEHNSALFFKRSISPTSFPLTEECMELIERSKDHNKSFDADSNLFLDIDLSILGQERKKYLKYSQNIRKEFSAVPDKAYAKGRRTVLNKFLEMDKIFKSAYFYKKYEDGARDNIQFELKNLLLKDIKE